jgi:hypothetical protein
VRIIANDNVKTAGGQSVWWGPSATAFTADVCDVHTSRRVGRGDNDSGSGGRVLLLIIHLDRALEAADAPQLMVLMNVPFAKWRDGNVGKFTRIALADCCFIFCCYFNYFVEDSKESFN